MLVNIFKIILSIGIGLGWLFFSGDGAQNISVLIALFVLLILFIKPTKFIQIQDDRDYKEKVANKQLRKLKIEEERLMEKKTQKEKGEKQ